MGVPDSEVDDLCQEVLLVIHRRLEDFDGRSLRSWIFGICARVASDYRRSARVRRQSRDPFPELHSLQAAHNVESDVASRELEDKLKTVLDRLDHDKRRVFVLYELEELTLREITETLGIPLQTVHSILRAEE